MAKQFENPEATKTEDETISDAAAQKRLDHVAEKMAEKSSRTEQKYDTDHQIFSK
jgi:hypothetical protein